MEAISLTELATGLLNDARNHQSGRAAHTLYGGSAQVLRQTLIALAEGRELAEHQAPGEATLQVLIGRVRLSADDQTWHGSGGDLVVIPPVRHGLLASEDAVVLLTVAKPR